jgi:hypothetical protein
VDLQLLDQTPARPMTPGEQDTAKQFYEAVQAMTRTSERSLQASARRIGVSELGFCSEKMRRVLKGETAEAKDMTKAFVGTALGDHIEAAIVKVYPRLIRQSEVTITLVGDSGTYTIGGHPDLVDPDNGILLDVKTVNGLRIVQRTGPSQQQQFQRHCYAKAAHQAGFFADDIGLSQVQVGNVWFDRSAEEVEPYVQMEPYDERVVEAATQWLDDVVYAYRHDEEARKEPPIAMCAKTCGFYLDCRAGRGGPQGLLEDRETVSAVQMYQEALNLEREARTMKNQAKIALNGVEGSTGHYTVKWTKVNGGPVSYFREPYQKLDIRKVR